MNHKPGNLGTAYTLLFERNAFSTFTTWMLRHLLDGSSSAYLVNRRMLHDPYESSPPNVKFIRNMHCLRRCAPLLPLGYGGTTLWDIGPVVCLLIRKDVRLRGNAEAPRRIWILGQVLLRSTKIVSFARILLSKPTSFPVILGIRSHFFLSSQLFKTSIFAAVLHFCRQSFLRLSSEFSSGHLPFPYPDPP